MRFDVGTAMGVEHCSGLRCDTMLLGRYQHGELVATILRAEVPRVLCNTVAATVWRGILCHKIKRVQPLTFFSLILKYMMDILEPGKCRRIQIQTKLIQISSVQFKGVDLCLIAARPAEVHWIVGMILAYWQGRLNMQLQVAFCRAPSAL
jgi:hypothetical protein